MTHNRCLTSGINGILRPLMTMHILLFPSEFYDLEYGIHPDRRLRTRGLMDILGTDADVTHLAAPSDSRSNY
ncbi:MAG: hypothetical protein M0Q51_13285 [Bacteroidales bacterium]|nr:hypothetical protein [Bacteroidales bacterium]